jgi:hypothetical protein
MKIDDFIEVKANTNAEAAMRTWRMAFGSSTSQLATPAVQRS